MLSFQFNQKVKVLYGEGCVNQLGELVQQIGCRKALVVADPGMMATGAVEKVVAGLEAGGAEAVVFTDNEPNPPIKASEAGYEVCVREGCDCVIGLGGGSNMDCAKGINILRFNEGPLIQYANFNKPFDVGKGLIMIPTTAGTGSELSDGSILSDENHIKFNFVADQAFADYAVVDPGLMAGMPPKLTAYTGLDAFTHLYEGMTGTLRNEFVNFFAEKGLSEIVKYLPRAVADGSDMEARKHMAVAAAVGGFSLLTAHTHAGHSIAQTVGGYFNIPHGMACAYFAPYVIEFNAPAVPEETKTIGEILGVDFSGSETPEEIGTKTAAALTEFIYDKCKLPSIKTFNYDESKFDEIAGVCEVEFFQMFNPRKMTKADCLDIIERAFR